MTREEAEAFVARVQPVYSASRVPWKITLEDGPSPSFAAGGEMTPVVIHVDDDCVRAAIHFHEVTSESLVTDEGGWLEYPQPPSMLHAHLLIELESLEEER